MDPTNRHFDNNLELPRADDSARANDSALLIYKTDKK